MAGLPPDYRAGGSTGGLCGCMAALLFAAAAPAPFLLGSILGDCAGEPDCPRGGGGLWLALAIALVLGAALGLVIRLLLNRAIKRRGAAEGMALPPVWAAAAAVLLLGLAICGAWALTLRLA